jgi:hypothetical protein
MLKKNGQLCQHTVPNFSGRLTDTELDAYNSLFASIEPHFKELTAIKEGAGQLEQSLPQLLARISSPSSQSLGDQDGSTWGIITALPGTQRGEMLWCKRQLGEMEEFAVVERYDPNSPLAIAQGEFDVQMTDTDPMRLLRDFLNARREAAHLFASDIIATAQEQAAERFPGEDLHRVLEAISQRCKKGISPEQTVTPAQTQRQGQGMHV